MGAKKKEEGKCFFWPRKDLTTERKGNADYFPSYYILPRELLLLVLFGL